MLQALGWGISTVEQTAGRDCGTAGVRSDVALAENNLDIEKDSTCLVFEISGDCRKVIGCPTDRVPFCEC